MTLTETKQVRYVGFTLRTECSSCGMPLPLGPPARHVACTRCHADNELSTQLWLTALQQINTVPKGDAVEQRSADLPGRPLAIQVSGRIPSCEKCGALFAVDELPSGAEQSFACTSCGDRAATYPAPPWLRELETAAAQIFVVEPVAVAASAGAVAAVDLEAPKPVAMSCPQCGGGLQITAEHSRMTACQYCQTEIFLPDAVWRRLHPVKQVQWWYLRLEGPTSQEIADREACEEYEAAEREQRREQDEQVGRNQRFLMTIGLLLLVAIGLMVSFRVFVVGDGCSGKQWSGKETLHCEEGDHITIRNRTVKLNGTIIHAGDGCNVTLNNVKFSGKTPLFMGQNNTLIIKNSRIEGTEYAIFAGYGVNLRVENSHIMSRGTGICDSNRGNYHIENSRVQATGTAIATMAKLRVVGGKLIGGKLALAANSTSHTLLEGTEISGPISVGAQSVVKGLVIKRLDRAFTCTGRTEMRIEGVTFRTTGKTPTITAQDQCRLTILKSRLTGANAALQATNEARVSLVDSHLAHGKGTGAVLQASYQAQVTMRGGSIKAAGDKPPLAIEAIDDSVVRLEGVLLQGLVKHQKNVRVIRK